MNDDSFRAPGSPFEHEEVVAFAVVPIGFVVDWTGDQCPDSTLWIPVSLFDELAESTGLGRLAPGARSRLDLDTCIALEEELRQLLMFPLPDEPRAAALRILARVREVRPGAKLELLVDRP